MNHIHWHDSAFSVAWEKLYKSSKNGVSDGANGFHGNYDDDGIYVDMCVIKHY